MNTKFSENLKKLRKENNLSQEQLAEELGVSRQAISKWESATAYPEMDKIIALCDKFNVNIDDLLHNDIKEVRKEAESNKKLNNALDDFLKFITDTVNMFSSMTFKSKIKCLFEQAVIILVLYILSHIIIAAISTNLFNLLPDKISMILRQGFDSILGVLCFVISAIIVIHVFKTRYLDYYKETKSEKIVSEETNTNNEQEKNTENKNETKKEDRIIIRDPKHSEYRFINGLFKAIVIIIKFFLLWFALGVAGTLVGIFAGFIISFMFYKTGIFFLGLILASLSSGIITAAVLILILNFVFNRRTEKKAIVLSIVGSIIVFGMSCGLIFRGALNFEVTTNDNSQLEQQTFELAMTDNTFFHDNNITYVESDIDNIRVEYKLNKYCHLSPVDNNTNGIHLWTNCDKPITMLRETIKSINDKKLVPINSEIEDIVVYANQENIAKMNANKEKYNLENTRINELEEKINELERENAELREELIDSEFDDNEYDD